MNDTLHDFHRPLGGTGLTVSPLGLGTVKLGRDQGVKYPNGFRIPDDAQARQLLRLARDLGINLIDTAPAYGISEQRLGPLLQGQREHWVVVSKVGEEFVDGQFLAGAHAPLGGAQPPAPADGQNRTGAGALGWA